MKTWIWGSVIVLTAILSSLVAGVTFHEIDWLHIICLLFTYYGVLMLVVALLARRGGIIKSDCYRPFVSAMIPARNEEDVIEATVRSLCRMHYRKNGKPNFEVIVIDDGSTDATIDILERLREELPQLRVVRRLPPNSGQGKSAVLNEGMRQARGEILAVFDADTRVEPNFLVKTAAYLYDPTVAGVQARVRIYNATQNALTSMQEDEFSVMSHLMQIAKDGINGVTALGGNGQLTRRSSVEEVGGWNEMSTTEDLDLTMRLLVKGYAVRYSPEAVLWQEAVSSWRPLLRQRVRWAEGFIKCLYDYTLPLCDPRSKVSLLKRLDGLFSMARVLIPLWVWVGYLAMGLFQLRGQHYHSHLPVWLILSASWIFFVMSYICIRRVQAFSVLKTCGRVIRYWAYNFIWIVAVPIGFYKCVENFNTIKWDKTVHRGESKALLSLPEVLAPRYRQQTEPSLIEVGE